MSDAKRWVGVVAGLAMAWPAAVAQTPMAPLTLAEAVRMALEKNPEVLMAREQLQEVKGKVKEIRASAYPKLDMEGFGLRSRDPGILNSASFDEVPAEFRDALKPKSANLFDVGLTIKQPLYTAGKVRNAILLAEEGLKEKEAAAQAVEHQIGYRVFQAYHEALLAEDSVAVLDETLRQRQKQLEMARNRFSQGAATEVDVLRAEVSVANLEPDLIRARNRIRMSKSALNNLIVMDLESPIRLAGKLEYRSWDPGILLAIQEQALKDRPELSVAAMQLQEMQRMLALARAESRLSVDMESRVGTSVRELSNFMTPTFTRWSMTVSFRLPFYDGGRKAGLIMQALSRVRTAEENLAQLQNNVRLEVKAAYDDLQTFARAIHAAELTVTQAEKVLAMMQANFQYGAATTLELLDSQTALTASRYSKLSATFDHEIAKARLRWASGAPILEQEKNP